MVSWSPLKSIVAKINPNIDQDLPYSYEDKFSRDKIMNHNSAVCKDKTVNRFNMSIGFIVIDR